jgi:uncharacterized protein YjbI with pentapeptide repeats
MIARRGAVVSRIQQDGPVPRRPCAKLAPDRPDLALELLEPSPARLDSHDRWVGLHAASELSVAELATNVELRESVLSAVDLAGRDLSGLLARDVRFERCDLSGTTLDGAHLTRVEFAGCRMTGVMLTNAVIRDVALRDCQANLANWRMSTGSYLLAEGTSLREADFYETSLTGSAFLGCDLRQASFRACRLQDVDLHGSQLDGLRDASGLGGASIGPDQVLPLALALLAANEVRITDEPRMHG